MRISLTAAAKVFGREVVFQDLTCELATGSRTAIVGPNGSGKSTLLQVLAGAFTTTRGQVAYHWQGRALPHDAVHRQVAIAAPYLGLYEDLTLAEAITFHGRFKPFLHGIGPMAVATEARLAQAWEKPVRQFSSGMKQRLKLALAILSDVPLLLLDEPASNLDRDGVTWFQGLLADHVHDRTLVVASNHHPQETFLTRDTIDILAHKPLATGTR